MCFGQLGKYTQTLTTLWAPNLREQPVDLSVQSYRTFNVSSTGSAAIHVYTLHMGREESIITSFPTLNCERVCLWAGSCERRSGATNTCFLADASTIRFDGDDVLYVDESNCVSYEKCIFVM